MADAGILETILNFGSFGLVAWLFIHTFTKLIPSLHERLDKLIDRFETALDQQHMECMEILSRQQSKFDQLLAEFREHAREELEFVTKAYDRSGKRQGNKE